MPSSVSFPSLSLPKDEFRPSYQEPHVICTDAPLTPPLSPKPGQKPDIGDECIPINSETHQNSQLHQPQVVSGIPSDLMDVDTDTVEADSPINPMPRPQRLLEDEKEHLQRTGIKLSDFEAPIIPRTSSVDDTRHFLHLPLPPSEEIPGLTGQERHSTFQQLFHPSASQFLEF
ncbi:hypothetical protein CVT25_011805 [Psilocybe cyanescens]|uniref:Uncharacterized protein n=1 Tax=Psilocybe cyanescens TaxID=93625 RepID=A0A409WJ35_PSICY|nr:hypothetical protein CVT25_011805 [Psilocybe cyanescens]